MIVEETKSTTDQEVVETFLAINFTGGKEKLFLTKVNGYFSDEYFEDLPILDIKIVKDFINNFNQKNF